MEKSNRRQNPRVVERVGHRPDEAPGRRVARTKKQTPAEMARRYREKRNAERRALQNEVQSLKKELLALRNGRGDTPQQADGVAPVPPLAVSPAEPHLVAGQNAHAEMQRGIRRFVHILQSALDGIKSLSEGTHGTSGTSGEDVNVPRALEGTHGNDVLVRAIARAITAERELFEMQKGTTRFVRVLQSALDGLKDLTVEPGISAGSARDGDVDVPRSLDVMGSRTLALPGTASPVELDMIDLLDFNTSTPFA